LLPAEKGGRGKKADKQLVEFSLPTISAYRKIAANVDRLPEYYASIEDVPTAAYLGRHCHGS